MSLQTTNLATGANKPKLARADLKDLMQRVIDYPAPGGASLIGNTPAGGLTSATVQGALNELDARQALTPSGNTVTGLNALTNPVNDGHNTVYGFNAARYLVKDPAQPLQRGVGNTVFGSGALADAAASCDYSTAYGYLALGKNTTGYCNYGAGLRALGDNTTGTYNSMAGADAGFKQTTASNNSGFGAKALLNNITGANLAAFGTSALASNLASENTAFGALASYSNTTGTKITSVGFRANELNITGSSNTAVGFWALRSCTASNNTAIGDSAMINTSTGQDSTGVGYSVLRNNDTGSGLVAVGYEAAFTNVSGNSLVAIGYRALYNATAGLSTAVGHSAGLNTTSGSQNTYYGRTAGSDVTTGSLNVLIGDGAGVGITSGNGNTALGFSAIGSASGNVSNATGVGSNAQVTGSNQVQLGDSSTTTYAYGAVQNRSDRRDKTDIADTSLGLDFIMGLQAKEGRWDYRENYPEWVSDGSKKGVRLHQWFIAQEVQELCKTLGVEFGGLQDHSINGGKDVMSLGYSEFIPPIVKAIQQIKAVQDSIAVRLDALES